MSNQAAKQRIEAQLHANAARPLFSDGPESVPEKLPHVYTSSSLTQNNILSHLGTKYLLPIGTQRTTYEVMISSFLGTSLIIMFQEYEEVIVPPAKPVPPRSWERLKSVGELDPLAQGCFSVCSHMCHIRWTSCVH
jgi:antiviral helicase SLH1